ncbi:MAG: MFS transporter, partial [Solirubrobacteraceae bacterium]
MEPGSVVAGASPFASLRIPAFRWWFLAQILSGSWSMAQGVGTAWLILKLTGSGVDLGLLTTALFGPVLLAGAWAGALLDHVDHRRALIATQVASGGLALALFALTATGAVRVWMVFALSVGTGFVFAVDQPARQLYVVDLVGRERVQSAVGLFEVMINASRVLGPATGGVMIATLGVSACFLVNAASFVPPLLVLLWFR